MNDSRWTAVLTLIVERRLTCRVKLLSDDYAVEEIPGASVFIAYDQLGRPYYLEPHIIWRSSVDYWEAGSIGPFRPRDIEWLSIPTVTLATIREELPAGLHIVTSADESIIIGYEFE